MRAICSEPGCYAIDCQVHRSHKMRAYNQRRRASTFQFYDTGEWRRTSKAYLASHPTCECGPDCCPHGCGRRSRIVDHIVPRPRGAFWNPDTWDNWDNLQALARTPCHARKTMRETNARRR